MAFYGTAILVFQSGTWEEVARVTQVKRRLGETTNAFLKRCKKRGETLMHDHSGYSAVIEVDYAQDQPTLAKITLTPTKVASSDLAACVTSR